MKNILKTEIESRGLSLKDVSLATGIKYNTVYRHFNGSRHITAAFAIAYERGIGIPKHVLLPEIFGETDARNN